MKKYRIKEDHIGVHNMYYIEERFCLLWWTPYPGTRSISLSATIDKLNQLNGL
jgi:hypothetical protein